MTVIIQARDPNETNNSNKKHKEVTGTYIPSDGEFALDVWIKNVDALKEVWKESNPLPIEVVNSITADAIIEATADYPLELIWFSETNRVRPDLIWFSETDRQPD